MKAIFQQWRGQIVIILSKKLVGFYVYSSYTNRRGNQTATRGQIRKQLASEDNKFQVTFENGKHKTYEYENLINKLNEPDEEGVKLREFDKILKHRWSTDLKGKEKLMSYSNGKVMITHMGTNERHQER